MTIHRLKVSGLLSFGPEGLDMPMESLNVLIGPNGAGKSNLLEVLALLRAAPRELARPIKRNGGIREWLWKGDESPHFERLDSARLKTWLDEYSLGDLWSSGELGGNRW